MQSARVVIVEPDALLAEMFRWLLDVERLKSISVDTGRAALDVVRADPPELVIAEAELPDIAGEALLDDVRTLAPGVGAVLMAAPGRPARPAEPRTERLVKPFAVEQLLARVRRLTPDRSASALVVGDLVLDEDAHEVRHSGRAVRLSLTEFELLRFFMRNPGRVLPKTQILARVWDYDYAGDPHVVENYVSYLRRKIGHGSVIRTVRGVGYVLDARA